MNLPLAPSIASIFVLILIACGETAASPTETVVPATSIPPTQIITQSEPVDATVAGFTHVRTDGNRYATGQADLPNTTPDVIRTSAPPVWVVGVPYQGGVIWATVLSDGSVVGHVSQPGQALETKSISRQGDGAGPPVLYLQDDEPLLLQSSASSWQLSPPTYVGQPVIEASLQNGKLFRGADDTTGVDLGTPEDARILTDENGRVLVLTGATERYPHGVIGDSIESSGFALLDSSLDRSSMITASVESESVIEGISPIWADVDGDDGREIIVTVSNDQVGAGLVVYNEPGDVIARGPAIGRGGRWRHQIAVAPFGPDGEIEIVDVLTPHIGGIVEFFQIQGDELVQTASVRGYSSHRIGSRNLDMAAAADFDGDGNVELLVADQHGTRLAAIRHTANGAEEVWSLNLSARLATNLGVVTTDGGAIEVAAGLEDGTVLIWRAPQ
ncbi:MAG: hypothetical protein HQ478_15180 [Chloroflexi bacterium]|nr:hypothetical protein [Chloroflexota bacterium]